MRADNVEERPHLATSGCILENISCRQAFACILDNAREANWPKFKTANSFTILSNVQRSEGFQLRHEMATTASNAPIPSGTTEPLPPPTASKKSKAKKDKPSMEDNAKLIQARLAQLEQEKAGEKSVQAEVDREVKKESRVMDEELHKLSDPIERADALKKKYDQLLADMKKLEREFTRSKKRADQLQKDKDKVTQEFNKVNTQKDKMEKLSRTFQQENKKLKDDNKRLEDTERTARETVNDRLDSLLYDVQDVMNSKAPSHGENLHMELDEV